VGFWYVSWTIVAKAGRRSAHYNRGIMVDWYMAQPDNFYQCSNRRLVQIYPWDGEWAL